MSKHRSRPLPGGAADLAFSMGTFVVLWTILCIPTMALRPELEPIVGTFAANAWRPGLAVAYCIWQFRKQRRLRREAWEADSSASKSSG